MIHKKHDTSSFTECTQGLKAFTFFLQKHCARMTQRLYQQWDGSQVTLLSNAIHTISNRL